MNTFNNSLNPQAAILRNSDRKNFILIFLNSNIPVLVTTARHRWQKLTDKRHQPPRRAPGS